MGIPNSVLVLRNRTNERKDYERNQQKNIVVKYYMTAFDMCARENNSEYLNM